MTPRTTAAASPLPGRLFTLAETAAFFNVKPRTVQGWRASGRLRVLRISSRCVRVAQSEIERLLREAAR